VTVRLTIGSLLFSSDATESNLGISEGGLQGWFSSPPVKTVPDDRANSDGVFGVSKVYRSARPINLPGLFTGTGDPVADALTWRMISGILAAGNSGTIEVDDPAGALTSDVLLTGDACVLTPLVNGMASYELPTAGGGLQYNLGDGGSGGTLYYGANGNLGRITLTNGGTADVYPLFTVTGQLDGGFYIQRLDTGDQLRYERVVPAGSTVSIDSRTGEVLVDGTSDASTYLTRDDFFPVPAMSSIDVQFNPISTSSGTPTMTASQRDGWW
jgi:hypothetical protein